MAAKKKAGGKSHRQLQAEARKHLNTARKRFAAAERKAKAYVTKHPERAAMIAAGVGAAVGAALTAAMRRKKK